jgi:hypothetical protein
MFCAAEPLQTDIHCRLGILLVFIYVLEEEYAAGVSEIAAFYQLHAISN